MSSLDVAIASFWQLARHWQLGEAAKLEIPCEAGSLNVQLNAKISHPCLIHFHHPSAPTCKRKSPSLYCPQEHRCHAAKTNDGEAKSTHNLSAEDIAPSKKAEKPKEAFLEQYSSDISPMINPEKPF